MRSLFSSLGGSENRKIADRPLDTGALSDFDKAREHFRVKWVVHRYETLPAEVENSVIQDLDKLVESCRGRFSEMRGKYPNTPPDGFLVFDGAGTEVRRWFEFGSTQGLDTFPPLMTLGSLRELGCKERWRSRLQHHKRSPGPHRVIATSIRLDAGRLDDRPPLFDFGLLLGAECFGTLLLGRWNFLALVSELPAHRRVS